MNLYEANRLRINSLHPIEVEEGLLAFNYSLIAEMGAFKWASFELQRAVSESLANCFPFFGAISGGGCSPW